MGGYCELKMSKIICLPGECELHSGGPCTPFRRGRQEPAHVHRTDILLSDSFQGVHRVRQAAWLLCANSHISR